MRMSRLRCENELYPDYTDATEDMIKEFPYRPTYVMNGVGDILK